MLKIYFICSSIWLLALFSMILIVLIELIPEKKLNSVSNLNMRKILEDYEKIQFEKAEKNSPFSSTAAILESMVAQLKMGQNKPM